MTAGRVAVSASVLLLVAWQAGAGEPAVVVLADGQTLEGEVTVEADGRVRIDVPARGGERPPFQVTLAPEAVEKVLPAGSLKREVLPRGIVELADGRELRGEVLASEGSVVVRGPYGQVEVSRGDVVAVRLEEPEPPRTCADADLGLSLRIPEGWSVDEPGGIGERLRLVRDDGRVRLSVLVRQAPLGGTPPERVRRALEHDLIGRGGVAAGKDGLIEVSDAAVDAAARQRPLRIQGSAELRGDLVVWYRVEIDASGDPEPGLEAALERLIGSRRWLEAGRSPDGSLFRDAALRLAIEAPPGWRLVDPDEPGQVARMTNQALPGAALRVHLLEDPGLEAGLRDLLEEEPAQLVPAEVGGVSVVRSRSAGERGLAYAWAGKTVVVVARAPRPEELVGLTMRVTLIDPQAPVQEAKDALELLPRRAAARELLGKGDMAGVLATTAEVLASWEDDPETLQLRVAAMRDRVPAPELVGALDDAWFAYASPWIAEELGLALLDRAREEAAGGDHVAAGDSYARAAEVWPSEAVAGEVESYYVGRAKAALAAGDRTLAWSKLATARRLLGPLESLDAVEAGLRLEAARGRLKENDPQGARREARKGWLVGADPVKVDQIYAQAEQLELKLERDKAANDAQRRNRLAGGRGGLEFGIPPSRSGGSGTRTVRPAAMLGGKKGTRVRGTNYSSGRSRRVRPAFSTNQNGGGVMRRARSRSGGKGRRVRSNGQFVFE